MSFWAVVTSLPWTDIIKLVISIIGVFKKADQEKQAKIVQLIEEFNSKEDKDEADVTNLFDGINNTRRM